MRVSIQTALVTLVTAVSALLASMGGEFRAW